MRKNIINLVFLGATLIFTACGGSSTNASNKASQANKATVEASATTQTPLVEVSEEEIRKNVTYLASDELAGRETGTEGIEKAAAYIEGVFLKHNIEPYFSTYRDHFSVNDKEAYNVIGYIEGNDPVLKDQFIILGAHYDHVGREEAVDGDEIANGANDNATGTAGIMEVAKHFSKTKNNKRSILFVLFSAEELGLKGSEHLAKKLKKDGMNLYTMLNFEMIGVPMKGQDYEAYLTGFNKSNFAEKFNEYAGSEVFGFLPQAAQYQLFQRSDNFPFYREFNVPAQTFSTFDFTNYDYYHHVKDEADLMDYPHMAQLIEKVIPGIERMANTPEKEIKMNQ